MGSGFKALWGFRGLGFRGLGFRVQPNALRAQGDKHLR